MRFLECYLLYELPIFLYNFYYYRVFLSISIQLFVCLFIIIFMVCTCNAYYLRWWEFCGSNCHTFIFTTNHQIKMAQASKPSEGDRSPKFPWRRRLRKLRTERPPGGGLPSCSRESLRKADCTEDCYGTDEVSKHVYGASSEDRNRP